MWTARLRQDLRDLHGQVYRFVVRRHGRVDHVPDPQAERAERRGDEVVSLFANLEYRWRSRRLRTPAMRDLVIYEAHLPALSRHESTPLENERHRGTYAGAHAPVVIDHLQRLGVAMELLPLHASDHLLGQDWGYFSTSFRAPTGRYAVRRDDANRELMALVDAMHARGIPVLLDVVFNHGAELLLRAWGADVVYRKNRDGNFCHGSGCGPTVRTEHPLVREAIIDALRHMVRAYRIDGFRFDLGALHDVETIREIDRRLPKRVYLVAEPWALGGAQWGKGDMCTRLADTRWAVWNDDFREPGQAFVTGAGDIASRDRLMRAIKGTHVDDGGWCARPQQSINYLSSHDGKTLADLVGSDKQRVFMGVLLLMTSQGVPMLAEGSELMFSKGGDHNSYNRPDLNQIDWRNASEHEDLVSAVAGLIELRRTLPHFKYVGRLRQRAGTNGAWDIDWIFPTGYPHHDNPNALGFTLLPPPRPWRLRRERRALVVLLNGSSEGTRFELPPGRWRVVADARELAVDPGGIPGVPPAHGSYYTHPGTGVALVAAR